MAFIKEESEDMKIEETLRVKHDDTEEQTGWFFIIKDELTPLIFTKISSEAADFIPLRMSVSFYHTTILT